jgi:TRAP-type uncharacterized transport system fused permease subunit
MPTPAVYIMGAALLAPILRKYGLPEMQLHLFMLFYACLSAITPPVAVANFAAGAIAGVNPTALGPYAVKLAIGGFVVPFFFLFNPGLTVQGSLTEILLACVFGTACTVFASFALHGLLGLKDIAWPLRLVLSACTIATIVPRLELQAGAMLLGAALLAFVYLRGGPAKVDVPAG